MKYEYEVHVENGSVIKGIKTRENARNEKRDWMTLNNLNAKILRRVYKLECIQEIR